MRAGRRSWTSEELEAIRAEYFRTNGNQTATARKFNTQRQAIAALVAKYKWDEQLETARARSDEKAIRTVVEARAKIIRAIDKYTDRQEVLAPSVAEFDAHGLAKLATTRELLTGGATERVDLGAFLEEWSKLDPAERRELLARARSKRSTA